MLSFWNRKKAGKRSGERLPPADPQKLIAAQSLRRALLGGVAAALLMSWTWMYLALLTGRVFPWFSILQGIVIGLAVRRFGLGLDWRFPLTAAVLAWVGAYAGNVLIAIPTTAEELGVSGFAIVRGLTWWSFQVFFDEVITVVDHIYAFCAVAVAAFYAKRRLNRREEFALRTRREE